MPKRFADKVLGHAIAVSAFERYPLILAIQGPAGDGKSLQVRHVLRENGFAVIANSSALLAGSFQGEPVRKLRDLYGRARDLAVAKNTQLLAILLEDFDLSPAAREDSVRYTVNSQLLAVFLMNLADDVASCEVGTTQRFPIFLTGNNFSRVHQPLTRSGRMNFFSWEPTDQERSDVIFAMLNHYIPNLKRPDADRISRDYKTFPIAFFDAAIMDCIASKVLEHVEETRNIDLQYIQGHFSDGVYIGLGDYAKALRERGNSRSAPRNFLRSRS